MRGKILSKEYLALALIEAKNNLFHENFATIAELNQFENFIQQQFTNQKLDIIVYSNNLSKEDFSVVNGVIMLSNNCAYNLDMLSREIYNILTDVNLIVEFFMTLESEKLNKLENIQQKPKSYTKKKFENC